MISYIAQFGSGDLTKGPPDIQYIKRANSMRPALAVALSRFGSIPAPGREVDWAPHKHLMRRW
jgi:hypothetical protein